RWRSSQSTPSRTTVPEWGVHRAYAAPLATGPDGVQCSPGETIVLVPRESGGRLVRSFPYPHFLFLTLIFFHSGLTPSWLNRLRRMRTARNTRSLTAPTDIPNASAISS